MGILALKALARGPWPEGADRKRFPKCWYQPLHSREEMNMGLRFTLSHPVTAAVPPGDETLYPTALDLAAEFKPLTPAEAESIKKKAMEQQPLFKYPSAEAV